MNRAWCPMPVIPAPLRLIQEAASIRPDEAAWQNCFPHLPAKITVLHEAISMISLCLFVTKGHV